MRRQLDEMQALVNQSHINPSPRFQEQDLHSPRQLHGRADQPRRGSACTSSCSQFAQPHQQDGLGALIAHHGSADYVNSSQSYQRSIPDVSTNGVTTVAPMYTPSNGDSSQPKKRKRSCFEIREESIADFIDKGLITPECAVSCFNTCVQSIHF